MKLYGRPKLFHDYNYVVAGRLRVVARRLGAGLTLLRLLLILGMISLRPSGLAQAQSRDVLTQADCRTAFPNCRIYLTAASVGGDPAAAAITVSVDGASRQASAPVQEQVGAVVAFALDEFVSTINPNFGVRSRGLSGELRFVEFRQSAINFFEFAEAQGILNPLYLAAYRTGETDTNSGIINTFPPIVDWVTQNEINAFFNEVSVYEPDPDKNTPETPLYGLIQATVDNVLRAGAPGPFSTACDYLHRWF